MARPKVLNCTPAGLQWRNYSRDLRLAKWGPTGILRGNNPQDRMSALGQKQTSGKVRLMSALPPKADIGLFADMRGKGCQGAIERPR